MSSSRPPGFSPVALAIVHVLRPHTPFAEAIVRRQAERAGLVLESMAQSDLPKIVPLVIAASLAFVDPMVIDELKRIR